MIQPGREPRVVIVLLTTNALDDTVACIRSLLQSTYANLRIVVVDNASIDGSEECIKHLFPEIEYLQTGKNGGFAASNNAGIRLALQQNPSYVLLLNNDTLVDPGFLEPLVDALEADPMAGCATSTICYYPETDLLWYAGGDLIWWRGSGFSRNQDRPVRTIGHQPTQTVTFISGCFMLLRREVLDKIGLLDERTFLYCEDTEYSMRMASAGYRLLYVPAVRIYHKTAHRNKTPFTLYYIVRNRLHVISLGLHGWRRAFAMSYVVGTTAIKMVFWYARRRDLSRAAFMGLQDYFRGVLYEGRGLRFPYRSQPVQEHSQ
jgi:hypothetical protein